MNEALRNLFALPELRTRILFTLGMLAVFRLGSHVPVPGVNARALTELMQSSAGGGGGVFGMMDMFTGGALSRFSVFSLGIMPYISTSIIMQLMTTVVPALERLSKEGESGRRKINQWTRYGTVILCVVQGSAWLQYLKNLPPARFAGPVVGEWSLGLEILIVLTITTGTVFLMWLGEQISEHGVGNGMSLLIFSGIVARVPFEIGATARLVAVGEVSYFELLIFIVVMLSMTALAIVSQQAHRKIPVQYPQRSRGGVPVMGGVATSLPLKVDYSGVIAVIFASSLLILPTWMARLSHQENVNTPIQNFLTWFLDMFSQGKPLYEVIYGTLIVFFCYFYTAVVFNPTDVAENMKKFGGFVPGIRPGPSTAEHIDRILSRVTLVGALMIVVIAILPEGAARAMGIPFYFGGTTLLITVGVALDTLRQIESHLLMHHYEGFMKKAKLQGRMPY